MRCCVSDGLHIRWRETAPDRGLLTFALAEIDALHSTWPETLQCNIVIERARLLVATADEADLSDEPHFHAQVELDLGRRSPPVRARALHSDLYAALRTAFGDLRDAMPAYTGHNDIIGAAHNDPIGAVHSDIIGATHSDIIGATHSAVSAEVAA